MCTNQGLWEIVMKKIYFLGLTLLSVAILASCSTGNSTSEPKKVGEANQTEETTQTTTEKQSTTKTFAVGDKILFEGNAEFTITGVEWTGDRNSFEDVQPEKVLKVTYNVTNVSSEDIYVGGDLSLYVDGNKMETYPNENTYNSLSPNRSFEGATLHFGVNGNGSLELEIKPSWAFDETIKPAIVTLD